MLKMMFDGCPNFFQEKLLGSREGTVEFLDFNQTLGLKNTGAPIAGGCRGGELGSLSGARDAWH